MQENLNTPPFAAGQRIIRVGDSNSSFKKGEIYTCAQCFKCSKCGEHHVQIQEFPVDREVIICSCKCGKLNSEGLLPYCAGYASNFAPIQTQYTDITKELADSVKETVEAPDKILIPQTVNN